MKKILYSAVYLILMVSNLKAQLSPGDLHKSHAFLEGIENCTQCHTQGKKLTPDNCLNCHTILKDQIEKNKGLHANNEYKDCIKCHVDHLGREFELVYWGKKGKNSFEHSKTGYSLEGAHKKLNCEKCHNESKISNPDIFKQKGKNLNRTFLGLDKECSACHLDEHRGQLSNDCLSCHNMNNWKETTAFNHNTTNFHLTGKHKSVKCSKCHRTIRDDKYPEDNTFLSFSINKFNSCQNCHKDVHNNRFGDNCTKCHNTSGWSNYNKNSFDHSKTLYPLKGKHALLRCEQCHLTGQSMKIIKYNNCRDCHSDAHNGQFISRIQKGACEECHTVDGFSPSRFTLEMHQECSYPLKGSHLAVPCLDCHKTQTSSPRDNFIPFRFKDTRCNSCHEDIHAGEVDGIVKKDGCEGCHSIESWHNVSFDHNDTDFKLQGRHSKTNCVSCHKYQSKKWHFKNVIKDCFSCHKDVHQGQFSAANQNTDCSRCHSPTDWLADRFDHEQDSYFSLQGAHQYVSCDKCHKKEERNGQQITIYRPLDKRCESCHKE